MIGNYISYQLKELDSLGDMIRERKAILYNSDLNTPDIDLDIGLIREKMSPEVEETFSFWDNSASFP